MKQTEELFANGKVTSGGGRGKMFANGTAFADGTAFSSGSGGLGKVGGSSVKKKTTSKSNKSTSKKSTSSNKSTSSKKSSSSTDDFEESFDWIEIVIQRIERAIDRLDKKASGTWRSWTSRNKNLSSEISQVSEEIEVQENAYKAYIAEANSVGLSSSWKKKVQNGTYDVSTVKDESLAEKIKQYQEFYEKAMECKDAVLELKDAEAELYQQRFDNIIAKYNGVLQGYEHTETMLNEYISQAEENGNIVSEKYYKKLISNEKANISKLKEEQKALVKARDKAVNDGKIAKYSEQWYEMCAEIDSVTQAIENGKTSIIEYENAIRQIKWDTFDLAQERISNIVSESEFLIDLMSNKKLYDDNGQLTNEGKATTGLHGQNYNVHMSKANNYANEVKNLNQQIKKDPYDQELINRRNEILELQRESILAAEDEKNAIRDIVEEGINLELDALQQKIDKHNELLDSQKNQYEYSKKVKEQTKEIASIEKQMSAYSNDDSEETKKKVQELKISLEEAKQDLQETEYEKYISDQEQLLDNLYNEYEIILNSRLDNIDALISETISSINANAGVIASTIYSSASDVGYTLSSEMQTIWQQAYNNAQSENQQRVSQATAVLEQMVKSDEISKENAEKIKSKLAEGDAQSASEVVEMVNEMKANGTLTTEGANKIVASLSLGNQEEVKRVLELLDELVKNNKISGQDVNTIVDGLVTGDAKTILESQNIVNKLVDNGTLTKDEGKQVINALKDSQAKGSKVVAEYDKNYDKKKTTTNKAVNNVKTDVKKATKDSNKTAENKIKSSSTPTSAKSDPTKTNKTTTTNTTKKTTTKSASSKRSEKDYYGVALAIWNGNYGWGVGDTRVKRLKAKGFDSKKMQTIVNKLGRDGYVPTGAWEGKYYGIKNLKPYHYNKFVKGAKNINKDQLAWTQEKGLEYIVRPSDGAILTPIAKDDSVLNTSASNNIFDMANNPADFIKDNLNLGTSNVPNYSNIQSSYVQNLDKVVFNLPNVKNYEELLSALQKDKNFERLVLSMSIDRLAGKSSLAKGKAIR